MLENRGRKLSSPGSKGGLGKKGCVGGIGLGTVPDLRRTALGREKCVERG